MHVLNRKYLIAVVITIAIPTMLLSAVILPTKNNEVRLEGLANIISLLTIAIVGIAIGTSTFVGLRRSLSSNIVRLVSAIISGFISSVAGGFVGLYVICPTWQILVAIPNGVYGGDDSYAFLFIFSIMLTALVGCIFGAGLGQSTHRSGTELIGTTDFL